MNFLNFLMNLFYDYQLLPNNDCIISKEEFDEYILLKQNKNEIQLQKHKFIMFIQHKNLNKYIHFLNEEGMSHNIFYTVKNKYNVEMVCLNIFNVKSVRDFANFINDNNIEYQAGSIPFFE